MEDNLVNTSMYEALSCLNTIETSLVSMFATDDKYAHPPFFRFRFKNINKNDLIYENIRSVIQKFKGNLEWDLIAKEDSKNYVILPAVFIKYIYGNHFFDKNFLISEFGHKEYISLIDASISDIYSLSNSIRSIQ